MFGRLLVVATVLIIVLFALVYRVFTLSSIAREKAGKPSEEFSTGKLHGILFMVFFFVGFGAIFWYSIKVSDKMILPLASEHGGDIDFLFWLTTGITGVAFLVTHMMLFFIPYFFRHDPNKRARFYPDNMTLEKIWTFVPAIALTLLIVLGWTTWSKITAPVPTDEEVVEIEVMGKQFNWELRYGGKDGKIGDYDFRKINATNSMGIDYADPKSKDDFKSNVLYLPKGRNVLLKIRARDVIHSVFLPHFRVKMDAVPGMPTQFWFKPNNTTEEIRTETGNPDFDFEMACTEICGKGHFGMRMKVVVQEQADFDKWHGSQTPWAEQNADEYNAQLSAKK